MKRKPKHLYKYRAFSVHTLKGVDRAEVYYADPDNFNDPLDCSPTISVDIDVKSLERLLYKMLVARFDKERALKTIDDHRYMVTEIGNYATDPDAIDYYRQRMASQVNDLLCEELGTHGILSLAGRWNCPLMWSHYADEHRGLCIEYSLSDTHFSDLRPVSYDSPRAIQASDLMAWKIRGDTLAQDRIFSTFSFAKAKEWR